MAIVVFDEAILARVMHAVLTPAGVGHLENPEQQQRLALALRAARFGAGEFVSGRDRRAMPPSAERMRVYTGLPLGTASGELP